VRLATYLHTVPRVRISGVIRLMVGATFFWRGGCKQAKREGNHWGDLGVDGWIVLGWISRRWDVGIWTGFGWPRIETGGGRL
jgi:hypothetical protein